MTHWETIEHTDVRDRYEEIALLWDTLNPTTWTISRGIRRLVEGPVRSDLESSPGPTTAKSGTSTAGIRPTAQPGARRPPATHELLREAQRTPTPVSKGETARYDNVLNDPLIFARYSPTRAAKARRTDVPGAGFKRTSTRAWANPSRISREHLPLDWYCHRHWGHRPWPDPCPPMATRPRRLVASGNCLPSNSGFWKSSRTPSTVVVIGTRNSTASGWCSTRSTWSVNSASRTYQDLRNRQDWTDADYRRAEQLQKQYDQYLTARDVVAELGNELHDRQRRRLRILPVS